MKNLMVWTAVLALVLLGSAGIANAGWTTVGSDTTTADNVGIGTTTPGAPLSVVTTGSNGIEIIGRSSGGDLGILRFKNNANTATRAYISAETNVGLLFKAGPEGPHTMKLDLSGDLTINGDQYVMGGFLRMYEGNASTSFKTKAGGDLQVYTYSGSAYKNILLGVDAGDLNAGNVGIGIASPTAGYRLDVGGVILANDLDIVGSTVSVLELINKVAVLEATPPAAQLLARLEALEAIVMDLPPGLRNIDRNGDGK